MRRTNTQFVVGIATWGLIASLSLTPAIAADSPARLAGASRVDTAVQVATHAFAGQKPPVVYLASADQAHLVDATTAGKLADGPLLYAPADSASATALGAKLAANPLFSGVKRVVAVGGKASVHEATLQTLAKSVKASQSERLAGADRYETSVEIAKYALSQARAGNKAYAAMLDKNGQARAVYVANGGDNHLVDSMVAGTLGDGPTILTRPDGTLSEGARQLLMQSKPQNITGLGGASAISDTALQQVAAVAGTRHTARLGGADRYATAAQVAQRYTQIYGAPAEVYVAGSSAAADAIIGGQLKRGPILLVAPHGTAPTATAQALTTLAKQAGKALKVVGLGGANTVPSSALDAASQQAQPNPNPQKPAAKPSNSSPSGSTGSSSSGGSTSGSGGSSSGTAKPAPSPSKPAPSPSKPAPTPNPSKPAPAPSPTQPAPAPAPKQPTLTIDKTTLNADNSETAEITVKKSDGTPDAEAKPPQLSKAGGITPPEVGPKGHTPGVLQVKTNRNTTPGKYKVTFTSGDGKTTWEKEVIVKKKHTTPAKLVSVGSVTANDSTSIKIADYSEKDHRSGKLKMIIDEITQATNSSEIYGSYFKLQVTDTDINDSNLVKSLEDSLYLEVGGYTIKGRIPSTLKGKSFKIKMQIVKHGYYEASDFTPEVTVRVNP